MSSRYRRRNINEANKAKEGTAIPAWAELNKMKRPEIDKLLQAAGIESTGNLVKDRAALNKARG